MQLKIHVKTWEGSLLDDEHLFSIKGTLRIPKGSPAVEDVTAALELGELEYWVGGTVGSNFLDAAKVSREDAVRQLRLLQLRVVDQETTIKQLTKEKEELLDRLSQYERALSFLDAQKR